MTRKPVLIFLVIALLALIAGRAYWHFIYEPKLQARALTISGKRINPDSYANKAIVLTYWADWCHVCKSNIPVLNAFSRTHAKDAVVFALNFDNLPGKRQQALAEKFHMRYPLLLKAPAGLTFQPVEQLPTTYVFKPNTTVASSSALGHITSAWLESAIQ